MTSTDRHIRLEGAHNVRDLGGYAMADGASMPWRTFLRADALHELSPADIATLKELGLRTVIDLRSDAEIARQPSAFARDPDVRYHHISLFDGLAPVDAMMAETRDFDLSLRYIAALDGCRPALLRVAQAIASAEDGVVLFNCTAGKDRTGIIAAMLLSLAGVAREVIADDYALTASHASALMDKLKVNALARGLDEAQATRLLSSESATMLAFLRHVDEKHGGFRRYLGDSESEAVMTIATRITGGAAGREGPGQSVPR